MDIAEARLWERRNKLEQHLISALGADWWRQRRQRDRATGSVDAGGAGDQLLEQ